MTSESARQLWLAAPLAVIIAINGCGGGGEKGIIVKGKLLKGGQPATVDLVGKALPPGESGRMMVVFYPVKDENEVIVTETGDIKAQGSEQATVEADGSFHLGKGTSVVKPGKYRIVVTHVDPTSGQDMLKGTYNEQNSKITREVAADKEITIDLSKPGG